MVPTQVKLIASLFSSNEALIEKVIEQMQRYFGKVDWVSEKLLFNRTRYYEKEMGWPLYRRFLSFAKLISADSLPDVKLETNRCENTHSADARRMINIDPGYISPERLVLATGKNYIHRVYLTKGIYADLTLVFHAGTFTPLVWTYPDYADVRVISYFNTVRNDYLENLRKEGKESHA